MTTIQEFIAENNITMTAIAIHCRTDNNGSWGKDATHWICTFTFAALSFAVQYSQGSGHTKHFYLNGYLKTTNKPLAHEVLYSVLSDLSSVNSASDKVDWLIDLGYDMKDLRQGEASWYSIKNQEGRLRVIFGNVLFNEFINCTED